MAQEYVLKIIGINKLVFKTRHNDKQYLEKMANLLLSENSHFKEFKIHPSDNPNSEMTEAENLVHQIRD